MKGVIAATVTSALLVSVFASAKDEIPSTWLLDYHQPQYDVMFSRGSTEPQGPSVYRLWHKIVYKSPQKAEHGSYAYEIVQIEMNCEKNTVALVRDLKYTDGGTILSDTTASEKSSRPISYYGHEELDDFGKLISKMGLTDEDDVCRTPD